MKNNKGKRASADCIPPNQTDEVDWITKSLREYFENEDSTIFEELGGFCSIDVYHICCDGNEIILTGIDFIELDSDFFNDKI